MNFDVCNLSDKIGASLLVYIILGKYKSGKYNVNHCCPKPESDCPGQSDNLIVAAWGQQLGLELG